MRQVGGDHYERLDLQPLDVMKTWFTPEEYRGFLKGNVVKYLARKKGEDDLKKALHYLQLLVEVDDAHAAAAWGRGDGGDAGQPGRIVVTDAGDPGVLRLFKQNLDRLFRFVSDRVRMLRHS